MLNSGKEPKLLQKKINTVAYILEVKSVIIKPTVKDLFYLSQVQVNATFEQNRCDCREEKEAKEWLTTESCLR